MLSKIFPLNCDSASAELAVDVSVVEDDDVSFDGLNGVFEVATEVNFGKLVSKKFFLLTCRMSKRTPRAKGSGRITLALEKLLLGAAH